MQKSENKRKLASNAIIGNELTGKTLDTNSNYVAKKLHSKESNVLKLL